MRPQHSANILFSVPKGGKVTMCLMEKMCVLNKFHSGINYSAFSYKFVFSQLYIQYGIFFFFFQYGIFKQKHT